MGGRPRDDEVKEEPDEDEAAMLLLVLKRKKQGSREAAQSHRRRLSAGWGVVGEAIMTLAAQGGEAGGTARLTEPSRAGSGQV